MGSRSGPVRAALPPRARGERRRDAILGAAFGLFSRHGYRRVGLDDIARAAGVPKEAVGVFFGSKDEVFRALARRLLDRVLADAERVARGPEPFEERLRHTLDAKFGTFFALVVGSPHARELIDAKSRLAPDIFRSAERRFALLVLQMFTRAEAEGEIAFERSGVSPATVVEIVLAGGRGLGVEDVNPPTPRVFRRRLEGLARLAVAACGRRAVARACRGAAALSACG